MPLNIPNGLTKEEVRALKRRYEKEKHEPRKITKKMAEQYEEEDSEGQRFIDYIISTY